MTGKTTSLYPAVLEQLHQLVPLFAPTQLIADFEDAPAAAFRAVFGEQLQISGCWFHYAHSVIRRMKKNWDSKRHTRRRKRHSWRFDVFCRSLSYHPMKLNLASETCSRWT